MKILRIFIIEYAYIKSSIVSTSDFDEKRRHSIQQSCCNYISSRQMVKKK